VTRDEYEARCRRLTDDIDAAYAAFNRARDHWDALCLERLRLSWQWQEQCREQRP
jgi:hypothetical protein